MNVVYNMDCLEAMRKMPDNAFDLAVVDPPYGDAKGGVANRFGQRFDRYKYSDGGWHGKKKYHGETLCLRDQEKLAQLPEPAEHGQRNTQKNHLVGRRPGKGILRRTFPRLTEPDNLGGNYFDLPPTRCFIVFRKTNIPEKGFSMAPVEYAWTSFNRNAEIIEAFTQGRPGEERFHPTQKPVHLYAEIFSRFAKPGMKILDTHLGSGSSRIAAYDAGLDFVGYEIDEVYFRKAEERFQKHIEQMDLFHMDEPEKTEQMDIFDIIGGEA